MTKVIKGGTIVAADRCWEADVVVEAEEISPEWAAKGTNVRFHTVVETAGNMEGK